MSRGQTRGSQAKVLTLCTYPAIVAGHMAFTLGLNGMDLNLGALFLALMGLFAYQVYLQKNSMVQNKEKLGGPSFVPLDIIANLVLGFVV